MSEKQTIPKLQAMKGRGEKIAVLTCYDATFARLIDGAGIEVVLVGDSLGMVIQGHENTLPVTLDDICYHTRCVSRVTKRAHIVADMPFMSYQASSEQALTNAGRLLKEAGAEAVKVEGGTELVPTVAAMVGAGIPVMAHIGMRPQMIHRMGGYKIQGRSETAATQLLKEARQLEDAGAYAIVLEGVAMEAAAEITAAVRIPTIGIGAGPQCDGQVLVLYDLLNMAPWFTPRFVKRYADVGRTVTEAVRAYTEEVKAGAFPAPQHAFSRDLTVVKQFEGSR
ncbi:MAG: 3-methyl-2-oxobutanoate hydroxymethyltransferase [Deltaproteobacteria bacterium]|nr:3-methyl-2-oxobutanoate hydroxymethyltransferase [Deltaproteobacteria bacterium]